MADMLDTAKPARRRRSDARRNVDAILSAACTVFGERPDASMEDIAIAAGVTRQTVYAHFPSRDALITALLNTVGVDTVAAMDAARLDTVAPVDALRQYLDLGWDLVRRYPFLLAPALAGNPPGSDAHPAGTARLEQLIRRGQRAGDFDRTLSAAWLTNAVLGLARVAFEQVTAGHLTVRKAATLLLESALRLCAAGTRGQAGPAPAADVRAETATDVVHPAAKDRSARRTTPARQ
jgi:AcrR family transcriptional regulator